MRINEDLQLQEKLLKDEIASLPKQKWKILKFIAIGIISPFILPFMPMRRSKINMASEENYWSAFMIFGVASAILTPIGCYLYIKDINYKIYSAEFDLEQIRKKMNEK